MAQSAPQLLLVALGPTETVAEPAPAPTSREPFGLVVANVPLETRSPNYFESYFDRCKTSSITCKIFVERRFLRDQQYPDVKPDCPKVSSRYSAIDGDHEGWQENSALGPVRRASSDVFSTFIVAYNSLRKSLAVRAKSLIQKYAALTPAFVGVASTYNPYLDGNGSDEKQTASGEPYDQLRGLQRSGSICGSSLVVSAMAEIIDPPLRWSRAAKSVSSSKSTMLVRLALAG